MAQILDLGKIRFQFKGEWAVGTEYQFNDVVSYKGTAYVYISTAKTTGTVVSNNTFWGLMTAGFDFAGVYAAGTTYGKGSVVRYNGSLYFHSGAAATTGTAPTDTGVWTALLYQDSASNKVYYVAPHGTDAVGNGTTLSQPFLTIKYATTQAGEGATIYVKNGTYYEQLPITVPANTAIIGDSQRTVFVYPASGNDDTGTKPNSQSTMFLMSNGSIINKMTFRGMTGWVPGSTPGDISTSTAKGCVVAFNPASPITSKSPYVLESVAIMAGGIGALVDGSVHSSGYKTMVFHEFTVINDDGVGYWMKDGGKAEIVSCFTYYCYFGYAASGGGQIRALAGNNSYGTYGSYSKGYLASETPLTGTVVGVQLNVSAATGTINVGDTVTAASGGTAVVTNLQLAANKIYVKNNTGTFTVGQTLSFTSGGTGTIATGGLESQKGFIIIAKGFSTAPTAGSSLSFTGDSFTYVVSTVSGTWVDTTSEMVLLLANEKATGSAHNTALALRKKFSQIRLTGHDFLNVGTGGVTTTNYPNEPLNSPSQANEVVEDFPGRVFYTSTDQDGNFRVGDYFKVDQGTGRATLNANAFDLSGLSSLRLGSIGAQLGEQINEFSSDPTLDGNSNLAVPTEYAVRNYFPQISTDVIPAATATSDLGSSTKRWDNVYGVAADFTGAVTVGGDLTVNGTTTTLNSTTLTVDDKNIEMGSVATPSNTTADGGGLTLKGATDKTIIWDNANANWTSSENWNLATGKTYKIANVTLLSPTGLGSTVVNSSLQTVGTLTSLASSGVISTSDTTSASSVAGSIKTNGGISALGNLYVASTGQIAGALSVTDTTASSSATTGALKVSGGVGVAGAAWVGGAANVAGVLTAASTAAATSTSTGALIVSGGAGIAGNLYAAQLYEGSSRVAGPTVATTFTAKQTFAGISGQAAIKFTSAVEPITVSATAATGTIAFDASLQSIVYYTANASANFTINVWAGSTNSINTLMATGEAITLVFMCTNGGTAYYQTGFQIDGSAVTPKWSGGTAPSSGNASSIDVYTYTITKTAASTYTVLASQTKFA